MMLNSGNLLRRKLCLHLYHWSDIVSITSRVILKNLEMFGSGNIPVFAKIRGEVTQSWEMVKMSYFEVDFCSCSGWKTVLQIVVNVSLDKQMLDKNHYYCKKYPSDWSLQCQRKTIWTTLGWVVTFRNEISSHPETSLPDYPIFVFLECYTMSVNRRCCAFRLIFGWQDGHLAFTKSCSNNYQMFCIRDTQPNYRKTVRCRRCCCCHCFQVCFTCQKFYSYSGLGWFPKSKLFGTIGFKPSKYSALCTF